MRRAGLILALLLFLAPLACGGTDDKAGETNSGELVASIEESTAQLHLRLRLELAGDRPLLPVGED
ncbi:MAG: hypothetical protein ABR583_14930 [Gaiellaceae bacterium]